MTGALTFRIVFLMKSIEAGATNPPILRIEVAVSKWTFTLLTCSNRRSDHAFGFMLRCEPYHKVGDFSETNILVNCSLVWKEGILSPPAEPLDLTKALQGVVRIDTPNLGFRIVFGPAE